MDCLNAKVKTEKGNFSNTKYYCLEITVSGVPVTLRLSSHDYMRLWNIGIQYGHVKNLFDFIAAKIND